MTDAPQIWHYGLIARWWAEFNDRTRQSWRSTGG